MSTCCLWMFRWNTDGGCCCHAGSNQDCQCYAAGEMCTSLCRSDPCSNTDPRVSRIRAEGEGCSWFSHRNLSYLGEPYLSNPVGRIHECSVFKWAQAPLLYRRQHKRPEKVRLTEGREAPQVIFSVGDISSDIQASEDTDLTIEENLRVKRYDVTTSTDCYEKRSGAGGVSLRCGPRVQDCPLHH